MTGIKMPKRDVRILLLGEDGVGKTSLILALVSEEFPDEVPARAEEITIPADVTPEKVPTHIVDFSFSEQNEQVLFDEVQKANVVCIVYAVDFPESITKITDYWLPMVRQCLGEDHKTPVILVGNKSDIVEQSSMENLMPIMNDYKEVETCIECSAKNLKNISEVFYYAQKAVLHPTAPLFLSEEKEMTPSCKRALTRIFKICDIDNDSLLNDQEINLFQRKCFNAPLQAQALEEVKEIVNANTTDGLNNNSLTLRGFLYLHTLFIQRGRHETTWTVLRKFGYNDDLQLSKDYLFPSLSVPNGCTVELTHQGFQFLHAIFQKYDQDKDGFLSPTELSNLFSTCPIMPWGGDVNNSVLTNEQGWISYAGFLAKWAMTTLLDTPQTLEYLAYLGYVQGGDNQLSAVQVTRERRIDCEKKQTSRTVYQCSVIGKHGVGKTAFLQALLCRSLQYQSTLERSNLPVHTVGAVPVYGQERYLVLHEVVPGLGGDFSSTDTECDVACFLYDVSDPSSFEYCTKIFKRQFLESNVPCLFVATKADLKEVRQDFELTPAEFCQQFKLPPPQGFSCTDSISRDVYVKLATMAAFPQLRQIQAQDTMLWVKAGLGIAALAAASYIAYKTFKKSSR